MALYKWRWSFGWYEVSVIGWESHQSPVLTIPVLYRSWFVQRNCWKRKWLSHNSLCAAALIFPFTGTKGTCPNHVKKKTHQKVHGQICLDSKHSYESLLVPQSFLLLSQASTQMKYNTMYFGNTGNKNEWQLMRMLREEQRTYGQHLKYFNHDWMCFCQHCCEILLRFEDSLWGSSVNLKWHNTHKVALGSCVLSERESRWFVFSVPYRQWNDWLLSF